MILTDEEIDEQLRLLNGRKEKLLIMRKLQIEVDALEARTVSAGTNIKSDISVIRNIIMQHYDLTLHEINSRNKHEYIILPRQIVFYLSRRLTEATSTDIGRMFGKDHGTVLSGVQKIKDLMDTNSGLKATVESLEKECVKQLAAPRGETETRK